MSEFIPRIHEDNKLQSELSTHVIVARVAMGLIFDNPTLVTSFTTRQQQNVEALALIGEPLEQHIRSGGGEKGVKLGYHYAYYLEESGYDEARAGLIIANPLILGHGLYPENRNNTLRQYTTETYSALRPEADFPEDWYAPDQRVFRTDLERSLVIGTAPIEEELATPISVNGVGEDSVTQAFKADVAAILNSTPLRPFTNRLPKIVDL